MLVLDKDTGVTVQEDVPWSEFTKISKEDALEHLEQILNEIALEERKTASSLAAGNKFTYTMAELKDTEDLLNKAMILLKHTSEQLYQRDGEFDLTASVIKTYAVPYKQITEVAQVSYFESDSDFGIVEKSFNRCIGRDFISVLDDTVDRPHLKLTIDREAICKCCGTLFGITYKQDLNSSEGIYLCYHCDYRINGVSSFFNDGDEDDELSFEL